MRALLLLLASALALSAATLKLYLKDGGYHIVREYHVENDRVRFFSTERGEWEEMPTDLVDLTKTERTAKSTADSEAKELRQEKEEEQAERDLQKEIASVPVGIGAYFNVDGKIRQLEAAPYQVVTNKKRQVIKLLSPIPIIPGKASVVIQGDRSKFIVRDSRPTFYFRPEKEERFGIVAVQPKKNARIVENIGIVPVANQSFEDRKLIPVFQQQIAENLYKVWPEKPLEPGQYAVIEFGDSGEANDIELLVWDFAYLSP